MKRLTRQRTEILRVIDEAKRPLSPQEILEAGRTAIPSLSIATIYRNLRDLQQDGMIQAVALPGDSPRYTRITTTTSSAASVSACSTSMAARAAWKAWRCRRASWWSTMK